ncbi:MAG: hypothetical protein HGA66_07675, partial [Holophaga sp.]|nr:hypothetical protein [Holophaga sp.]
WGNDQHNGSLTEGASGFTIASQSTSGATAACYKVAGAAGSYSETVTSSVSMREVNVLAAFKASANTVTYTAPAGGGSHTIVAISNSDTSARGSCPVTVNGPVSPPVATSLVASPTAPLYGGTFTLTPTYSGGTGTIDHGVDCPASGVASSPITAAWSGPQRYTLTVTNPAGDHDTTYADVTPQTVAISPITPSGAHLVMGGTQAFSATVTGAANTAVNWYVNDIAGGDVSVGTITSAGLYTATASGSYGVTAMAAANGLATSSAGVIVDRTVVALSPDKATAVGSGGTLQCSATVSGNANPAVTWSVDGITGGNTNVGTITTAGLYTCPTVTAKAIHTITATSVAVPSVSASLRILAVVDNTVVNAKTQYGAVGDGSTDDTASIQNALNATGNGICYLPSGTYLINPVAYSSSFGLNIPSGATLLLSPTAVLQCWTYTGSNGYAVVRMASNNIAMVGGTINGDRVARNLPTYIGGVGTDYEKGQGITITGGSGMFILGVTAQNNCCDGFYFTNNASSVTMSDCVADNNRRQGASLVHCHDIIIQYSTFKNTNGNDPACGIDFEPNSGATVTNCQVLNCTLFGNAGGGIAGGSSVNNGYTDFGGNGSAICTHCTISGCEIYDNGGNNYHLGGIAWDESEYITISGNYVHNNRDDAGIRVFLHFDYSAVSSNEVAYNDGYGILVGSGRANECTGTTVSGNNVHNNIGGQIYNYSNSGATIGNNP